jgi:hypothetical protein
MSTRRLKRPHFGINGIMHQDLSISKNQKEAKCLVTLPSRVGITEKDFLFSNFTL